MIYSLCILFNCPLTGWWDAGHLAVAQIAYEELQPEVKDKVDAYLAGVSADFPDHSDFISASIWADGIRFDGVDCFSSWHISSRPYDPEKILSSEEHQNILLRMENNDLVWIIGQSLKTLSNPQSSSWARGFMLRLLIHMVGDLHQPLHCTTYYDSRHFPKGDRGGTRYCIADQKYGSLHYLFDGAFGLADRRTQQPMTEEDAKYIEDLVSLLKKQFPRETLAELREKHIDAWRQESYDIAVDVAYGKTAPFPNECPTEDFMEEGKIVTAKRLALAGYRLADLLNEVFTKV